MRNLSLIVIYLFIFCISSCQTEKATLVKEDRLPKLPLKYLALGDSYTIGQSVDSVNCYPAQLAARLTEDSINIESLRIIARTGWTTDELQNAINGADLQADYDFVSLLIGVNNQFRGYSEQIYEQEFESLLQQAIFFAKGNKEKVFVVSIPDYAFTPYGQSRAAEITAGIDRFNTINKRITESYEVAYYDITPISREGIEKPELVALDRLHPSAEQYRLWVASFYEGVKEQLLD